MIRPGSILLAFFWGGTIGFMVYSIVTPDFIIWSIISALTCGTFQTLFEIIDIREYGK